MRLRTLLLPALLVATVAPATVATADGGQVRSVTASYGAPGGVTAGSLAGTVVAQPAPAVVSNGNEDKARVTATDSTGLPVALQVVYTPAGATAPTTILACSSTPWLGIQPGSGVEATPLAGRCADGQLSAPTQGQIGITFHRLVTYSAAPPAKRWAVIIGIRHYSSPTEPTYGGDGDATAVRQSLLHSGWLPDHILDIRDGHATAAAIQRAMQWLVQHSGPDTFTLFHYSGHICIHSRGPCGTGHTYLWSTDNRFVPETTVGAILSRLRGHAWVDIAGCEAGAFNVHISSPSRLFTGSSQPGRTSYEEPSWHESVWTGLTWDQAFLQGAASGGRPYRATIGQMVDYGVTNTPQMTNGAQAGTQHPVRAGGSSKWLLAAPPG